MKVTIDEKGCIGCGLCESICPEVFKMNGENRAEVMINNIDKKYEPDCKEAAADCPAGVIKIEE
jgi:ferredoxin